MDLLATVVLSLVMAPLVVLTGGPLRMALGLLFVLFFPGYTLLAALYTQKQRLGTFERLGLSLGLSIVVAPLVGLISNYTPWGITVHSMLFSLLAFILAMCGVAWYRRHKLGQDDRFTVPFPLKLPSWKGHRLRDKILSLLLVVTAAGAVITLGYAIASPKMGEHFTEFYVLGNQGKAAAYPRTLSLGEKGEVILGIINREGRNMAYRVSVKINDSEDAVRVWQEGENGGRVPVADNTISIENLVDGDKWEKKLFFEPLNAGKNQRVEFLLFYSKLREAYHLRSQISSDISVDIEINEVDGKGKINFFNTSNTSDILYGNYRLEILQGEVKESELDMTLTGEKIMEKEFQFKSGNSIFKLYQGERLVLNDSGAERVLYLWVDMG